ncbi:DNA polymerase III subunit delta' [Legionella waltersii]|uniref:DNA-directed DNA polymerase n=1 Tax=Legionella waltersii TaxID=66969 RepID=A0A0W1ALS9_9GAMM|nr:DNA polymerase III subunit delta' [Legionella waltersii]KTD82300.1 DNA polymerase III subunit delta' [Legionella waltersii]SNV04174.1 DNA polymerase III, delta prime subunit [Legionella waltersii]
MSVKMEQWQAIQNAFDKNRIPQAMLFVGSPHIPLEHYVKKVLYHLFCKLKTAQPCLTCIDCKMIEDCEHPDMEWVKPEKTGSAIKIDQIRSLQSSVYLSPQRSTHKVIVIDGAETMNESSSNALLKILEEPSEKTIFILLSKQIGSLLPTIVSRCQLTQFSNSKEWSAEQLLDASQYTDVDKTILMENAEQILEGLIRLLQCEIHPCQLVSEWSQYDLANFLWFLYLIYSQLQYMYLFKVEYNGFACEQINRLFVLLNPLVVFEQIDKINSINKKLSHNINMNHTLVMEEILFSISSGL